QALDQLARRLTDLVAATSDIGAELASYESQLEADPARLAGVHERRAALTGLIRKYGADLDAVLAWAAEAEQRLAASDTSDEALAGLAADRQQAAGRLSELITGELAALAMPAARVRMLVRHRAPVESMPVVSLDGVPVGAG